MRDLRACICKYTQRDIPGSEPVRVNVDDEADDPRGQRGRNVPDSFVRVIGVRVVGGVSVWLL